MVDRQDVQKLACIVCNEIMHGGCCNVLPNELDFIKDTFICKSCLSHRRSSLKDDEAVNVSLRAAATLISKSNSAANIANSPSKDAVAVSDVINMDKASFEMLMTEVFAIKISHENLVSLVSSLKNDNEMLMAKVSGLEEALSILTSKPSYDSSPKRKKNNTCLIIDAPLKPTSGSNILTPFINSNKGELPAASSTDASSATFSSLLRSSTEFPELAAPKSSAHWNEVRNKKKKKAPLVIGANKNSDLGVFVQKKWLHLSSFKSSVKANEVSLFIAKSLNIDEKHLTCYPLIKKDADVSELKFLNFKLGIPEDSYDKVFNSALWPSNIKVRPFLFQTNDPKKQIVPLEDLAMLAS